MKKPNKRAAAGLLLLLLVLFALLAGSLPQQAQAHAPACLLKLNNSERRQFIISSWFVRAVTIKNHPYMKDGQIIVDVGNSILTGPINNAFPADEDNRAALEQYITCMENLVSAAF